ncbi:MAG: glycogen debranching enzyme N-terminal domain-containing protein, partial [Dehalococcoidia bacterium]
MSPTESLEAAPALIANVLPVQFGREICGELEAGLRREWLVTNGLGGYASGTIAGVATRRYHGLLVVALTPCVGRTVLIGGAVEEAIYDGRTYGLSAHEYAGGAIDPHGYRLIESFELDGLIPVWRLRLSDALLERRIWMRHGSNTTFLRYQLVHATAPLVLRVQPLATCRDFHSLSSGPDWQPDIRPLDGSAAGGVVRAFAGATPTYLRADGGTFAGEQVWYWNFLHREETARGLDDRANLFTAGTFERTLGPGDSFTLSLSSQRDAVPDGAGELRIERARQQELLARAGAAGDPTVARLVLAADQFVVERWIVPPAASHDPAVDSAAPEPHIERGRSIIAGYHWFNDWGRDTMIALPGLTLATGRPEMAAQILRTFAMFVKDGLLPNNFPDMSGEDPGYNTADATLACIQAVYRYVEATSDTALVDELLPVLTNIVEHHITGT